MNENIFVFLPKPINYYSVIGIQKYISGFGVLSIDRVFLKSTLCSTKSLRKMLCGSHNKIWNLTNQLKKNETKNIRLLVFSFSSINLSFWCFLFRFFMWFARFQILICEPQSIWCKFLVLSWLYAWRSHSQI